MSWYHERFWLYRHFDRELRLLYIGRTMNVDVRAKIHFTMSRWSEKIAICACKEFDSYNDLCLAEMKAIAEEQPEFNRKRPQKCNGREINSTLMPVPTRDKNKITKIKIYDKAIRGPAITDDEDWRNLYGKFLVINMLDDESFRHCAWEVMTGLSRRRRGPQLFLDLSLPSAAEIYQMLEEKRNA